MTNTRVQNSVWLSTVLNKNANAFTKPVAVVGEWQVGKFTIFQTSQLCDRGAHLLSITALFLSYTQWARLKTSLAKTSLPLAAFRHYPFRAASREGIFQRLEPFEPWNGSCIHHNHSAKSTAIIRPYTKDGTVESGHYCSPQLEGQHQVCVVLAAQWGWPMVAITFWRHHHPRSISITILRSRF